MMTMPSAEIGMPSVIITAAPWAERAPEPTIQIYWMNLDAESKFRSA